MGMSWQVLVEDSKTLGPSGADRVQFLMEANEGQTRGTVDAVASSGEKSRLLLLLETRLPPPQARSTAEVGDRSSGVVGDKGGTAADVDADSEAAGTAAGGGGGVVRVPPCAVLYDEIDAHVGGRTAVAVGRLLANQGRDSQVRESQLCVCRFFMRAAGTQRCCGLFLCDQLKNYTHALQPAAAAVWPALSNAVFRVDFPLRTRRKNMTPNTQVVVVTHTASVAALADQHLVVDKAVTDATTVMAPAGSDGIGNSSGSGGGRASDTVGAAPPSSTPPTRPSSPAAADGADEPSSLSARRSRRQGKGRGGVSVSIREVDGREREEELARMAAGDMGGGAAAELAREMLRYSRRQGS